MNDGTGMLTVNSKRSSPIREGINRNTSGMIIVTFNETTVISSARSATIILQIENTENCVRTCQSAVYCNNRLRTTPVLNPDCVLEIYNPN